MSNIINHPDPFEQFASQFRNDMQNPEKEDIDDVKLMSPYRQLCCDAGKRIVSSINAVNSDLHRLVKQKILKSEKTPIFEFKYDVNNVRCKIPTDKWRIIIDIYRNEVPMDLVKDFDTIIESFHYCESNIFGEEQVKRIISKYLSFGIHPSYCCPDCTFPGDSIHDHLSIVFQLI